MNFTPNDLNPSSLAGINGTISSSLLAGVSYDWTQKH